MLPFQQNWEIQFFLTKGLGDTIFNKLHKNYVAVPSFVYFSAFEDFKLQL